MPDSFRFGAFELDPSNRRLSRNSTPVELNARYFDALALLVRESGNLVSKDRFLDEVWSGVPVTDEALTQCMKTLRKQLGDDAGNPRFIATVPKHGYRFIAPVETVSGDAEEPPARGHHESGSSVLRLGSAGTLGGGAAGVLGGVIYGFAGALAADAAGGGGLSTLLVFICVSALVATAGAAGVSFGIAAAAASRRWHWMTLGGAAGGLAVGGLGKLVGLDAFNLLLGQGIGDITGAAEGAAIGGAVGLAAWMALRKPDPKALPLAAVMGGTAGLLIPLFGGRMLSGSLDLLTRQFPASRLRLPDIAAFTGETGFGPVSQSIAGALEGALFASCVVGAMIVAVRRPPPRA